LFRYEFVSSIANVKPIIIWSIFLISLFVLYLLLKNTKKTSITYLFILINIGGIFEYIGYEVFRFYEITIILMTFYLLITKKSKYKYSFKQRRKIILWFFIFTIAFIFSAIWSGDKDIFASIRQYSIYAFPTLLFFIFYNRYNYINIHAEVLIIKKLLQVQIFASILKLLLIGFNEKMVGIFSISGGGAATFFPLMFFLVYWYDKKGKLLAKDWVWIILSLIVPISSSKRAVWLFFPALLILIFLLERKIKIQKKTIYLILFIPIIFYFGVRLNPTLNPDKAVFGSFNLDYVIKYITQYNLGGNDEFNPNYATGRMGGNIYFANSIAKNIFDENNVFGFGNDTYSKYGGKDERNIYRFGFKSKYMLSGWVEILIRFGLIVLVPFLIIMWLLLKSINRKKDLIIFLSVFIFSFIFYSEVVISNKLLCFLFIFLIHLNTSRYKILDYKR
jgi:hypothetical protein